MIEFFRHRYLSAKAGKPYSTGGGIMFVMDVQCLRVVLLAITHYPSQKERHSTSWGK